ncbi:MAG: SPFH domain-containing protein [Anaerolineales bacterium]|nr:SPFH domain-containing protein [Anaerolineales bacterium]
MNANTPSFSKIKEVVVAWDNIQRVLRSGDQGQLVPVAIPKDSRNFGWMWMLLLAFYVLASSILIGNAALMGLGLFATFGLILLAGVWLWQGAIVEIEQGTTGIMSSYGKIVRTLSPGRHYLWWPWQKVEFIVDTSTEIPYTAPVLACPTKENVPLKSIEFFLKFKIVDPVLFVRNIGASNFDLVLSSAVQDAIRQRSRQVETARAHDLRGSDVADMQAYLNRQMRRYGVKIIGANIPDVQLPVQYQHDLATRERIAKEQAAYEKEWELTQKQRIDQVLMSIERAKKTRDTKLIEVRAALNEARESVAQMIQEKETAAEKVRLEIEAKGRASLKAAQNEAKSLRQLGEAYRDNWVVLQYELARRRLEVGERLASQAPRPIIVKSQGQQDSALSMLLLSRILGETMENTSSDGANPLINPLTQIDQVLRGSAAK